MHPNDNFLRTTLSEIENATHRDGVLDPLLAFTQKFFEFVGLFRIHHMQAIGFKGATESMTERFLPIVMSLELPSALQIVYETHAPYLGPLTLNNANQFLMQQLQREFPRAVLLIPLIIGEKMAGILYADNGGEAVSLARVAAVLWAVQRCGTALEAMIYARKLSVHDIFKANLPV